MPEIQSIYIRQRKYIFFLLALYVLGWGFTSYQTIFLGLILGTSLSLFNLWLLARRTIKFGDAIAKGEKVRSLGMFSRMATAVLAVMITLEYPDKLHLYSVIIGLMTSYVVIMIDFFLQAFHSHK
ncbi:ATP synthase subunit I [Robertmurraya korlensis]|jgi:ATP synthase protein I|uniref:ATP synthase subunit I n=1 Tax=Robertmurraya TaxID=2837507 RepID=UPI000E6AEA72|nr:MULTISPECIES: ATP synthase subunit I [Bacillaceae]AYA78166.1 ATP synthase subunit [Bacillus sp. Y1]MCM3602098.1 ATP synthase subunit I [Robertmurraya korlensis]